MISQTHPDISYISGCGKIRSKRSISFLNISFISKAWGGRVSDVYPIENFGILENLIHGDLILADRGFTIQDATGLYCAEVKVPSFTKGKPKLSKHKVDTTHELAHV